jgi:uncharacterized protein
VAASTSAARLVLLLAFNGNSAVDLVILASAVIPPIAAVVICWLVWRWMKRESEAAAPSLHAGTMTIEKLDLLDWKRRVFELYAAIRASSDPEAAWARWREVRDELFRSHPQSPLPEALRAGFGGVPYFPYDPVLRILADVEPTEPEPLQIAGSADSLVGFTRFGRARFELAGEAQALELYWLDGYGGGVFVPFRDSTGGSETYSAGRYVLDSVKGADLGMVDGRLVLDFNFAYNPSCSYDDRWACPLCPPPHRLAGTVRAGKRI